MQEKEVYKSGDFFIFFLENRLNFFTEPWKKKIKLDKEILQQKSSTLT